jgi:hypothetical protein
MNLEVSDRNCPGGAGAVSELPAVWEASYTGITHAGTAS